MADVERNDISRKIQQFFFSSSSMLPITLRYIFFFIFFSSYCHTAIGCLDEQNMLSDVLFEKNNILKFSMEKPGFLVFRAS